jgi:serine/threonine-protein kinase HipA
VTPTAHLLKPATGKFEGYVQNEHFCVLVAGRLWLSVANSWTEIIGDIPVIVIERVDRIRRQDGTVIRIHQEDACQALGKPPNLQCQNDVGPSARDLFDLTRDRSSRPGDDVRRFLDTLIFNWLISGTDAHAKNYGFLLAEGSQVQLSPLYGLSSSLPYPVAIPPQ